MNPYFPTFTLVLNSISHRVAAGTTLVGGVIAAAAPMDDTTTVGLAGIATILVGGVVSLYKIYADSRKVDADSRANEVHRDDIQARLKEVEANRAECQARLKEVEARCDRLYDAAAGQQKGETLGHSLDSLPRGPGDTARPVG